MGPEVPVEPLGSLVDADRGISYGIVQPGQEHATGVPIVRVTDVRDGRISTSSPLKVDKAIEAKFQRTRLRGGELLLTLVGTVGETAVVPPALRGWNTARAVGVIPVRDDVGARWVRYALQSPAAMEFIRVRLNTTVQATLNLGDVAAIPVPLPESRLRAAILNILGTLDDKIELNRRTNDTLEAMARALFKSWFVDFDPVRAKAAGKQPAGMDAVTAALFPSEFVESEIGKIPNGWRATRLGETYTWSRAGVDPADSPTASFEHFSLPAFDAGKSPNIDLGATIKSLKFFVVPNAVLVSKLNPAICRVWLPFPSGHGTAVSSTEFLVAVTNASVPRAWLYGAFLSDPVREAMIGQASGTSNSHQRVRPDDIDAITTALGDEKLLARYDATAGPLHDKSNALRVESARLAQLRDAILPRLLSGELRIPDAERIVGTST